ncbi:hypothetical protein, variant [Verruconis gallopava]|uniref:RRM domain-containing protein n=1 Tax=Verruconis gallopava TaxID=253628 RepID=A0A0D2ASX5_9PEZI|nr:uncharacterized protein PV09_06410 [Verruconis gallopava]XP_016212129.1 hypothetical protein, variant [Verruconis gallopava]KIW02259.1 hypothetical protein PV09_06410 [Verruconis gallopava]KIW02260.1 hypothetical protein, variant [Verruconis gallopava]
MMPSFSQASKPESQYPARIGDLTVLPITFAPTSAYPHASTHYLYIRPDAPKDAEEISTDNQRSLFVSNVPVTASESSFRQLFKTLHPQAIIHRAEFASAEKKSARLAVTGEVVVQGTKVGVPIGLLRGKKRKRGGVDEDALVKRKLAEMELPPVWGRGVWEGGSSAVLVFVDRDAMSIAWRAVQRVAKEHGKVSWPGAESGLGLDRYITHHTLTYPSPTLLQQKVNAYLTHFSTLESIRNKQLHQQRNVPDEEGFITVTRGGRTGAGRIEDAQEAQKRLKERAEKRVGADFYRFQTREEKKKREIALKKKFEEDRRRVEEMRKKRGRTVPE